MYVSPTHVHDVATIIAERLSARQFNLAMWGCSLSLRLSYIIIYNDILYYYVAMYHWAPSCAIHSTVSPWGQGLSARGPTGSRGVGSTVNASQVYTHSGVT